MKLTCDICGGELQMNPAGTGASCTRCGMTYSVERLRKKLESGASIQTQHPETSAGEILYDVQTYEKVPDSQEEKIYDSPVYEQVPAQRTLRILRKPVVLHLFKAVVILDGSQTIPLGKGNTVLSIPVTPGEHTILVKIANGSGLSDVGPINFRVDQRDWEGQLYAVRGAWDFTWRLELWEV